MLQICIRAALPKALANKLARNGFVNGKYH